MRGSPIGGHPADVLAREQLVDDFIRIAMSSAVSQAMLAETLGVSKAAVYYLERRRPTNPRVATLQDYAAPLGRRLALTLLDVPDLPLSPAEEALTAGGFLGAAMTSRLRRTRESMGISRLDIERLHGWKWSSLAAVEYADREPYLSTIQRYARLLGGRVEVRWEAL